MSIPIKTTERTAIPEIIGQLLGDQDPDRPDLVIVCGEIWIDVSLPEGAK